jgi:hypothetical protein
MRPNPEGAPAGRGGWRRWLLLLLVIPYVGTLWVSTYAKVAPSLGGVPFFYWYQFLWIIIGAALTIVVYYAER